MSYVKKSVFSINKPDKIAIVDTILASKCEIT